MYRKFKTIIFGLFLGFSSMFNYISTLANDNGEYHLTLGEIETYHREQLNDIVYERFVIDGSDGIKRVAFKAAFDFSSNNVDMVVWDDYNSSSDYRKATVMEIAKDFEEETGRKVYAAVNGDFFIASYPEEQYIGKTAHTYMKDGEEIVYGWDTKLTNFGFNNEGQYQIQTGVLSLQKVKILRVHLNDGSYKDFTIDKLDKMSLTGEIGLYMPNSKQLVGTFTGKYIAKVKDDDFSYPIIANIVRDDNQKLLTNELVDIPEGHIGIAVNSFGEMINGKAQFFYEALQNGQKIEIVEQERYNNPGLKDLNYVIGGMNRLVVNGKITPFGTTVAVDPKNKHPRTTIGVTYDGEFFIQVIDGRQTGYSLGVTTVEQAQLALDLGAKEAIELDGGGSSTFILRINDELQVVNKPSDGHLRPVGNAILFVEGLKTALLPEDKPNCETYSHLEACSIDIEEPVDENPVIGLEPKDDNIDSNNYNIFIIGSIGGMVVLALVGIIIIKKIRWLK
ncbi:MAG: hypothetical protein K0Q49_48 [Haloplasmataceae bacterium]|jgi:hypothetical protein|nr:hypothetical protein [Haloplasmataceae bacterium]